MNSHHAVELPVHVAGPFDKKPRVEVVGEFVAWDIPLEVPIELDADGAAVGVLALRLPKGMYTYKLLVNGAWTLDTRAERTRSEHNRRNHVFSVGGSPEPLLFAPAPPWISQTNRGGVRIVAGLRHGHGDTLTLCWKEPADLQEHRTLMTRVHEEDEHAIFEVCLPVSSRKLQLRFLLADGRRVDDEQGLPFQWQPATDPIPHWWRDAVIYTIFVDRFRPRVLHPKWSRDPGPQKYAGGHLDGITHALPTLAELGVTVLYLTPIHIGANCHRYDMVDPAVIDPRLGGEPALRRLLDAAHELGMRVALDFTCSHAGEGFFAYEDVRKNGKQSAYASWFQWTKSGKLKHYGTRRDAPLLDLHDVDVRAYFLNLVKSAAERGIDALRLDAAVEVPYDFAREIRRVFLQLRPDGLVFGEFVHLHAYRFFHELAGDAATEFGFFDRMAPFLAYGTLDGADLARTLIALERERGAPAYRAVRFLCTHDHPRLATLARLRGRTHVLPLGFLLLFTVPGIPMLLYGEELGLWADRPEHTREDVWPDRMPMPWSDVSATGQTDFRLIIKTLAALRRNHEALRAGELSFAHGDGGILVYRREAGADIVDVALNAGSETVEVELDDDVYPVVTPLFQSGEVIVREKRVCLGPGAGVILQRRRESTSRRLTLKGNAVLRDRDFSSAQVVGLSRPSRLDLAITERCNLRCAHCITHAPERTSTRTAREWSPWLLDRIRDDLAYADHLAFVHGGESLVSPMLPAVLEALREERCGLSTMVHLLTNGVLLSASTVEDLVRRGVRSISVSLDGATAATNDAIREGGRFQQIVDNIRAVLALRRDKQLDLRLGISFVVLRQNISELGALVDLCCELGVDWLKLEEAAAVNAFAEKSLIRLDQAEAADAVRRAGERGRRRGLVMVDHTIDRPVWRCRLEEDEPGKTFLEADSFANRNMIHPCRGPWEIACIEANGDVRLGHFFGPLLGNVAETPLQTLWNNETARNERHRAMASRPCKNGPVTCLR